MRKFWVVILVFASTFGLTSISARADFNPNIKFLMMSPLTNANVGEGVQVMIYPINHPQNRVFAKTDSNGVVAFTINNEQYGLDWWCNACNPAGSRSNGATEYLIQPQGNGSIQVLSMADSPVAQNSNGEWVLSSELRTPAASDSPWKLMNPQKYFNNGGAHLMFLLTNGKVFVQTGGPGPEQWWLLSPDKNGNYDTGTWEQAPSPANYNPVTFNGVVLHDGNVMVYGGEQNTNDAGVVTQGTNMVEIYDVKSNTWHEVAPPNNGQGDWKAFPATPNVELPDGRVLIGAGVAGSAANESILYDPKANSWQVTGTNKVGQNSEAAYTLLQNDKVLSVQAPNSPLGTGTSIAEIFDPATGLWSFGGAPNALFNFTEIGPALGLPNGNVLQTGALGANGLYNLATNSWTTVPALPKLNNGLQLVAQDNEAAILPNGNILTITATYIHASITGNGIAAGRSMAPSRYVEYDWKTNSWIELPPDLLSLPSWGGPNETFFLPLPNGQVLVSSWGGFEVFTGTGSADENWLPVIDSTSSQSLTPGSVYSIKGRQLSGLTQGLQWGDEWEAATNYPLVRIVNNTTHHISYATTSNFSSTSIAPMTPSNFDFTLNPGVEDGASQLFVVANGLASDPVDVTITGGVPLPTPAPKVTPTPTPTVTPAPSVTSTPTPASTPIAINPVNSKQNGAARSVICAKGKSVKKISGSNPKCPSGYKVKK